MYKLIFFCPEDSAEQVKEAIFEAGAGHIGNYRRCSWQSLGQGQFQAMEGANPVIGEVNKLEKVNEYRIETLVHQDALDPVICALIKTHPYEEPAWEVYKLHLP